MLKPILDFVGSLFGVSDVHGIEDGYATFLTYLIAIFAGVVAFIASYFRHRAEHRNENSAQFIASSKTEIVEAMSRLRPVLSPSMTTSERRAILQTKDFFVVVAHFEMVAVYMSIGLASERIIRRIEAGNITRLFVSFAKMVPEQRAVNKRVLLYYECLFIRFYFWRASLLALFIRPLMSDRMIASRISFLAYYRLYAVWHGLDLDYLRTDSPPCAMGSSVSGSCVTQRWRLLCSAFSPLTGADERSANAAP